MNKNIYDTKSIRESRSVGRYFTDISRNKILSPEDEMELCLRVVKNEPEAYHQLVCANLKFVVSIAKQYQGKGLLLADLISEGNIGLMIAARRFDVTKGFKFISFAVWWIRQTILKAIGEQSRTVKLPKNQIIAMSRIAKFSAGFEQLHERLPGPTEIAEALEMNTTQVCDIQTKVPRALHLDDELSNNSKLVLSDVMGEDSIEIEDFIMQDSSATWFNKALDGLNGRETLVVKHYLGLGMDEAMKLEKIAERMQLSQERVRQIKDAAFGKLRARAEYLKEKLFA